MTRETRANLIFLGLFLCITVPGAVVLFKKKLDPSAAPMYLPDPVRKRLPYMVPQATADEVTRSVPLLTGQWVERVAREQGGIAGVLMHERRPVISDDRVVQVVGGSTGAAGSTLFLIAWSGGFGLDTGKYSATGRAGDQTLAARVVAARELALPEPVRRELMNAGYAMPPASVVWLEVAVDGALTGSGTMTVTLSYAQGERRSVSSVNVFTGEVGGPN